MGYMNMNLINNDTFKELDFLFDEYLPQYEEIWLFGNGVYSTSFAEYLTMCDIRIKGFVLSEPCTDKYMGKEVKSIENFKTYYKESHGICLLLTIDPKYYGEVYPQLMFLGENLYLVNKFFLQCSKERFWKEDKIKISFHIIDYCEGIACYGCTAASPIAEHCDKNLYHFNAFKSDLNYIKRIMGERVAEIVFTGGDIFLHPQLIEMIEYSREIYNNIPIQFLVNGINLVHVTDEFWVRLGKCGNITIGWTLYPIHYSDMEEIPQKIKTLAKGEVKLSVVGDSHGEKKTSWHIPFCNEAISKKRDWLVCKFHRDNINLLCVWRGYLTTCDGLKRLYHLNNKFEKSISSNLLKAGKESVRRLKDFSSYEEISDYMTSRLPLCDYCSIRNRKSIGEWVTSEGKLEEWLFE